MHVILATIGTHGDVLPYFGLGAALRAKGHDVTLATSEQFGLMASAHGFDFCQIVTDAEWNTALRNPDMWHPLKSGLVLAKWGVPLIERQFADLIRVARGADSVIVTNPGVLAARLLHEKQGNPLATLLLQPWMIPSAYAPPLMPIRLPSRAPRWAWKWYWKAFHAAGQRLIGIDLNRVRTRLGLDPVQRALQWWLSPQLVIGMFPEWFASPQPDWPHQVRLAGFPLYDGGPNHEQPTREALKFCEGPDRPIVFTFGTGMMHAENLYRSAMDACKSLGMPGIFLTNFKHQLPAALPDFIRHFEFARFRDLFPHCAAVVHHGGIGTVSQGLAAGIPQLIVPFAFDQMDNAARVRKLGAGDWLHRKRATGSGVASGLQAIMTPACRMQCGVVADKLKGTDPLAAAADLVDSMSALATPTERSLQSR
jgi:rhamnosyltransferase subunit B